jgi:hypothetical protein
MQNHLFFRKKSIWRGSIFFTLFSLQAPCGGLSKENVYLFVCLFIYLLCLFLYLFVYLFFMFVYLFPCFFTSFFSLCLIYFLLFPFLVFLPVFGAPWGSRSPPGRSSWTPFGARAGPSSSSSWDPPRPPMGTARPPWVRGPVQNNWVLPPLTGPALNALWGGYHWKALLAISEMVAHRASASWTSYYPFGQPMQYGPGSIPSLQQVQTWPQL